MYLVCHNEIWLSGIIHFSTPHFELALCTPIQQINLWSAQDAT